MSNPLVKYQSVNVSDEAKLIARAQDGDRSAMERLLAAQAPTLTGLARKVARQYGLGPDHLDDLHQEASLALVEAIHNWDPERGARLWTSAQLRVHGAVQATAMAASTPVTIPRSTAFLHAEDVTPQTAKSLANARDLVPIMPGSKTPEGNALHAESLTAPPVPVASIVDRQFAAQLVDTLSPTERAVITMAYGLDGSAPMCDGDIAAVIHRDRSRVVRIRNRALGRMRDAALAMELAEEGLA